MPNLRFEEPYDDARLEDWRYVHNEIIPADPLSLDDVRERVTRHHLEVVYLGDVLVGCSTVRPPQDDSATAMVIARILPAHRGQGFGGRLYERGLERARGLGAEVIETIVLGTNVDGLEFARRHGFVEVDRYVADVDETWHTMRLT
ncbi:GNAT family N-acetyltransferase [Streptomyces yaanensis]|uniref:GNAT family N-acetyltransferase n=1 Tax=Streptomyces yaanensis TaxID=1142239 RepID=A0ABV7SBX3_9ACTN|nr:GNAT family N-acetyltransferase [Streptomyces sp. CGMCC 4.7035]WNB98718.1 GNAT family N-acetyltransferase [Streptomyces sp. CGMCC 4.7035]